MNDESDDGTGGYEYIAAVHAAASHVSSFAGDSFEPVGIVPISADSHVTEPPDCYIDHIDPKYREIAPRVVRGDSGGDFFLIEGLPKPISVSIIAAAGRLPEEITPDKATYATLNSGGWDPRARILDQERDGIGGEILYPSIGLALCNLSDGDYMDACFKAYNRWLAEFVAHAPTRLTGIGQTAVLSPEKTAADLVEINAAGLKGVLLPCEPLTEVDYDDPGFDIVWETAVGLDMPVCFHILTSGRGKNSTEMNGRGAGVSKIANGAQNVMRANQDAIGLFIWGRIFERFPTLKLACVEADAGWVPHFMYRLDHFYHRHRYWTKMGEMEKLPSEYFAENVYTTFQDDWVAMHTTHMMNPRRLMWGNDFPHVDSTWPWSQQLLARHTVNLSDQEKRWILRDNVAELFNLDGTRN
jgi:uncharacterized protein